MPPLRKVEPLFQEYADSVQRRPSITDRDPPRRHSWLAWLLSVAMVVVLAACVAVGYLLWQQSRPTAATVDAAPAVPAAPAPAAATASQSTAPAAAAPKVEQIKNWFVVCPADAATAIACYIEQQLSAKDSKGVVMAWTVRRDAEGVVHAAWSTPTDVATNRGLTLDIGDGTPRGVPFAGCDAGRCLVQAILAPDYLRKLETANSITAILVPSATGKPVKFGLSSDGFAEALARLAPTE